jgi:ABC-2 type transport system ATP-binding protein
VGQYSLGMRQRLGIAQALLGDPQILLLDEPANGLDPEGIHWVRELLRGLADQGRAALVSSHLLGEVTRLADEVLVIRRGRFVTQAPVEALTQAASEGLVRVASEDDPTLLAALHAAGLDTSTNASGLEVHGSSTAAVGRVARDAGIVLTGLQPVVPDLEEVFMDLTSGGGIA